MNTNDIRYFVRCYELRSINAAAKELFITPQGLSKALQHLEKEFDVTLFERTAKGLVPTQQGDFLYQSAGTLLSNLEELEIHLRRLKEQDRMLRIGYSCGVLHILPFSKLQEFRREHPSLKVLWEEKANAKIKEKVARGELDIGYVIGNTGCENLEVKEIYRTRLCAVVYEGHPLAQRKRISVAELKDEPIVTLNENYECHAALTERCQDFGFYPNIVAETMESAMIYTMCEQKVGIGVDARIHAEISPTLTYVEIEDLKPWTIYALTRKDRLKHAGVVELLRYTESIKK